MVIEKLDSLDDIDEYEILLLMTVDIMSHGTR